MHLQKLFLVNFKNYNEATLDFSSRFNCFVGNNGEGKTNLLDAIHYLSFCKSFFNAIDSQNIMHDAPFFMIQGEFLKNDKTEHVYCGLKRNEKKQFKRNQKEYSRLAEHIGLFPLVMISPMDVELITEGSEVRRKFMDSVISQFDRDYLNKLINYNKALAQRNSLLKSFSESRKFDKDALEIWDMQLIPLGTEIYNKRNEFIKNFIPFFQKYYDFISGNKETVSFSYDSRLKDQSFEMLLKDAVAKDRSILYTSAGIHKDDLIFSIDNYPIKKFGSQGQQKSYLTALKLAQFEYLKNIKNSTPVLLLDDIFDKLDETRVGRLMEIVGSDNFGQVFITDTHKERIQKILNNLAVEFKIFDIKQGLIS